MKRWTRRKRENRDSWRYEYHEVRNTTSHFSFRVQHGPGWVYRWSTLGQRVLLAESVLFRLPLEFHFVTKIHSLSRTTASLGSFSQEVAEAIECLLGLCTEPWCILLRTFVASGPWILKRDSPPVNPCSARELSKRKNRWYFSLLQNGCLYSYCAQMTRYGLLANRRFMLWMFWQRCLWAGIIHTNSRMRCSWTKPQSQEIYYSL